MQPFWLLKRNFDGFKLKTFQKQFISIARRREHNIRICKIIFVIAVRVTIFGHHATTQNKNRILHNFNTELPVRSWLDVERENHYRRIRNELKKLLLLVLSQQYLQIMR